MAGRKPKPTAVKKLEGNPGKRKLNTKEPMPGNGMPDCPKWLLPEAKEEWNRLCKKLNQMGVLTDIDSNANTNVSMMGETFKYCAPIAGALGFSVEDTAEAIGLMANAGIKSTQAGTSLRTIMTNLSGEVKICGENIGEVTVATTNADGSMRDLSDILADCRMAFSGLSESEKAAAAESLVGKNAMSGFLALMNAGEGDIAKLSGAIDNCNGAAQSMADTMNNNLEGQLTILKSQLQELAISFGEILLPAVKKIVGWVQGFIDVLNSLPDGVKETIVTVALIAAALGPVLIIIGKIITAVGTIMTIVPKVVGVIKAVKTAFLALNATMLANPIVLIIAAIAALVAAFIYLWNNCDEFRQFWIDLWESIKEIAVAVWEALKEFFVAAWEFIKTTAEGNMVIEMIDDATGEVVERVQEENMVTNAVNHILGLNPMGIFYSVAGEYDTHLLWNDNLLPVCPNMIGGILLYSEALTEDADNIYPSTAKLPVAYASNDVNATADVARGSMNLTESKPLDNGYRFVWEFTPSQGNGTILNLGTPLFQYKEFCFGWGGNYGSDYRMCFLLTPYLASINNLSTAVVKTTDKTMKITYELTEEDS